jgi:hypothetical protein
MAYLLALALGCVGSSAATPATTPATTPAVTPLARATAAVEGLIQHFYQTESPKKPPPRSTGCDCFSCNKQPCDAPTCVLCGSYATSGCSDSSASGCYQNHTNDDCACKMGGGYPVPAEANHNASFFFACGQIGGMGGVTGGECACEAEGGFGCTNCYRWWSAVALESLADYAIAAGHAPKGPGLGATIMHAAESSWAHAPYNAAWNAVAKPVYVDDFAWYALAYLRVSDWSGADAWRQRAADLLDWAWTYGWDARPAAETMAPEGAPLAAATSCGGFWWNLDPAHHFKDSISIVELLHVAARLAGHPATPANEALVYEQRARSIWNWLYSFDGGRGLIVATAKLEATQQKAPLLLAL